MALADRQAGGMKDGEEAYERPESAASDMSDYCLPWLFDPNRHDHLPIEEQLQFYKHRNLRTVKIYKIATQMWGMQLKRKRIIEAPPMEQIVGSSTDDTPIDSFKMQKESTMMNSQLKPQLPPEKKPTQAEVNAFAQHQRIEDYKSWIKERKEFRKNLDSMGLSEEWLAKKPDRTALENKVLHRIIQERTPKHEPPPVSIH